MASYKDLKDPILILSSSTGLGNYSLGEAIKEETESLNVIHKIIEEFLDYKYVEEDFRRYYKICKNYPWLLYFIYRLPVNYYFKYLREMYNKVNNLKLKNYLFENKINTVIVTNHRSAFWVSSLKNKLNLRVNLIAFISDYYLSPGWKYVFHKQINKYYGPIELNKIPKLIKYKYEKIDLPVLRKYKEIKESEGDSNNVLVTGGGWGLGDILNTTHLLLENVKNLNIYVVCGNNECLYHKLKKADCSNRLFVYEKLDSLYELMKKCKSVITRPSALTITEAFLARRKIFLLNGLPLIEENNALYSIKHFNATKFSIDSFLGWYDLNNKLKINL